MFYNDARPGTGNRQLRQPFTHMGFVQLASRPGHSSYHAMTARLRAAGVPGTIAELVTTPLDERRHRLNGSGVLLVRAPDGTLDDLGTAAPQLGARCATRDGVWSFRVQSWSAR